MSDAREVITLLSVWPFECRGRSYNWTAHGVWHVVLVVACPPGTIGTGQREGAGAVGGLGGHKSSWLLRCLASCGSTAGTPLPP